MTGAPSLLLIIGGLAFVVLLANFAEKNPTLRRPLYGLLAVITLGSVIYFFLPSTRSRIAPAYADATSLTALIFGVIALLILIPSVRRRIAVIFPRPQLDTVSGTQFGFDPESPLHTTALILCVFLLAQTAIQFAIVGGLEGIAREVQDITVQALLIQMSIWLLFAMLGAGIGLRRSLPQTLRRLGLRAPSLSELAIGVAMAVLLVMIAQFLAIIWEQLVPPDVFQQQNVVNLKIVQSVNTLTLAFMLASTAAIGEEIAFRGALQPVFGIWLSAILFASIHLQYVQTPAALVIIVVGLGLGWLRRRYNTTTAIIAHFSYNFFPLALYLLAQATGQLAGLR